MSREDLTKAWREEAELHAYLGYVSPRNQPTPKPAGSVLPEKLKRLSNRDTVLQQIRDLHRREVIAVHESYGEEAWCPTCHQHYPCSTIRIIEQGDNK